ILFGKTSLWLEMIEFEKEVGGVKRKNNCDSRGQEEKGTFEEMLIEDVVPRKEADDDVFLIVLEQRALEWVEKEIDVFDKVMEGQGNFCALVEEKRNPERKHFVMLPL
ncbi:hypothetical protein ACJX0J_016051, partial [Zea mays]